MNKKSIIVGAIVLLVLTLGGAYFLKSSLAAKEETPGRQKSKETLTERQPVPATPVMAPDFALVDMNGRQVRLSDQRGKKVLINFWTTWCKYCRVEMPVLQKFYEQTKDKNWQVLMVNITSMEKNFSDVENYLKSNNFTFPVLIDKDGLVTAQYGINSIPTSFILNEKGEVIKTKMGPFSEDEIEELMK